MIQNVEAGGRVDKDGRLKEGDCIIEINGLDLTNASFTRFKFYFVMFIYSSTLIDWSIQLQ